MRSFFALTALAVLLAACGGGGSSTSSTGFLPGGGQGNQASSHPETTSAYASLATTQGTVNAIVSSTKFEMNQTVDGYIYVTSSSSTTVVGTVATGKYVQVTGTGWAPDSSNVNATLITIWSSAPSSTTVSGTVTALEPYGFTITVGGTGISVPIAVNGTTPITGGTLAVGDQVSVNGVGSTAETVTASSITITEAAQPAATPSPTVLATPPAHETTQGSIYSVINSSEFALKQTVDGYINVDEPSGTVVLGGTLAAGDYVQVTGTGWSTSAASMNATVIEVWGSGAPSSITESGTIVGPTNYGYTVSVNGTNVPVIFNSATIVADGPLTQGESVSVSGTGSTSVGILAANVVAHPPTPAPTATPAPISQTHVLTADYLGAPWGSGSVTFAQAAPYTTWAQSQVSNASALHSAGIKVQLYSDPNRTTAGGPLYTSNQATFAQNCSGTDVTDQYNGSTQYVMNVTSTAMQQLFGSSLTSQIGSNPVDAVFIDDSGPLSEYQSTFSPSLPCSYTDAAWISGGIAMDNDSPVPVIVNGLSILDGESPSESLQLLAGTNALGGNFESCYSGNTIAKSSGWLWTTTENSELDVVNENKAFECMTYDIVDAAANTDIRNYVIASFLLTYNPQTSILWERFTTPSGLHALPESGLVALDPVVPEPANVSSLQQSGGAYGRQYNECFMNGQFIGPCAVIVNPNSGTQVPNPYPQYQHTLVLSGEDVLDGGTAATNGPAAPTYIQSDEAAVVFP